MDWNVWKNKYIFIKLKDGGVYSGKVIDVSQENSEITFLTIIDKFNDRVTVNVSEIIKIKEERP